MIILAIINVFALCIFINAIVNTPYRNGKNLITNSLDDLITELKKIDKAGDKDEKDY